jgi:molybdopterin-guanine dinucleotide biosynthesis protein A
MSALAGLVLCGGASRRMGTEKALMLVDGQPLVSRVAQRIGAACSPVLLAPGWPGRLGTLAFVEIGDAAPGAGPLGGIVAGLASAPHHLIAVVAVDMPFASAALLTLLASLSDGVDAVVPVTDMGHQPLHAVYARSALPSLRAALQDGRLGVRSAVAGLRVREVHLAEWRAADPSGRFAININRTEDLGSLSLQSLG